ncbi:MAG: hypothetical protein K0Q84_2489 [Arthrobacter sp.]|nr:hypothetical protein [Arthrobacter sp.]
MEIGVADGHNAAGFGHPPHFPECFYRISEMLQDLVGMDDVEGIVLEVQIVDVSGHELGVLHAPVGSELAGVGNHVGGTVQSGHGSGRHQHGEVTGDASRAAADIQHAAPGSEVRNDKGRRILRGP